MFAFMALLNSHKFQPSRGFNIHRCEIRKHLNKDIKEGVVSKVWTVEGVTCFGTSSDSSIIERCTFLEDCQEIIAKYCE